MSISECSERKVPNSWSPQKRGLDSECDQELQSSPKLTSLNTLGQEPRIAVLIKLTQQLDVLPTVQIPVELFRIRAITSLETRKRSTLIVSVRVR